MLRYSVLTIVVLHKWIGTLATANKETISEYYVTSHKVEDVNKAYIIRNLSEDWQQVLVLILYRKNLDYILRTN